MSILFAYHRDLGLYSIEVETPVTRFVDVRNMVRWATTTGPETIIGGMIGYLRDDFRRWESFDKTARVASHTPLGVIELMPTSDLETYAFKYVNGHPSNPARGLDG